MIVVLSITLLSLSPGLYGKKKKAKPGAEPAIPQMSMDQKLLHALNRLTFGARPGDLENIQQTGLDEWIDTQLHPEKIAENPVLEAKLQPYDSLRMSTAELVKRYPTPQTVKLMADGRLRLPADPQTRYATEKMIERYKRRENADKAGVGENPELTARTLPEKWQLSEEQKQVLSAGKPPEKAALLESMPAEEQLDVLDTLPNGMRQRLFDVATPELRRRIQIFNGPVQVVNQDLMGSKILRAAYSNRQLEEVLTDFWYNHFNVNLDKGADRFMVTGYERDAIRPHVLGHFGDLLLATAKSPAMLFYLDNWQSAGPDVNNRRRQGLNENYGRELMELHTLGVDGGYTQQDVTEVARCFTGWTIRQPQMGGEFEFNPKLHDKGEKLVLGVRIPAGGGMEDGLKVIDILLHRSATAHFISKSLAVRFVADNPPESLVDEMAATFTRTNGDLRAVMSTMLYSREFWNPEHFRSKLKSPFEMMASAIRAVNGDIDYPQNLVGQLNQLGEPLYRKLEPTGYSNRGTDWMNSASLLARMNFSIALTQGKIAGVKVNASQFAGEPLQIERNILLADPSASAQAAIEAGIDPHKPSAAMVAGLILGSPDFQRR